MCRGRVADIGHGLIGGKSFDECMKKDFGTPNFTERPYRAMLDDFERFHTLCIALGIREDSRISLADIQKRTPGYGFKIGLCLWDVTDSLRYLIDSASIHPVSQVSTEQIGFLEFAPRNEWQALQRSEPSRISFQQLQRKSDKNPNQLPSPLKTPEVQMHIVTAASAASAYALMKSPRGLETTVGYKRHSRGHSDGSSKWNSNLGNDNSFTKTDGVVNSFTARNTLIMKGTESTSAQFYSDDSCNPLGSPLKPVNSVTRKESFCTSVAASTEVTPVKPHGMHSRSNTSTEDIENDNQQYFAGTSDVLEAILSPEKLKPAHTQLLNAILRTEDLTEEESNQAELTPLLNEDLVRETSDGKQIHEGSLNANQNNLCGNRGMKITVAGPYREEHISSATHKPYSYGQQSIDQSLASNIYSYSKLSNDSKTKKHRDPSVVIVSRENIRNTKEDSGGKKRLQNRRAFYVPVAMVGTLVISVVINALSKNASKNRKARTNSKIQDEISAQSMPEVSRNSTKVGTRHQGRW